MNSALALAGVAAELGGVRLHKMSALNSVSRWCVFHAAVPLVALVILTLAEKTGLVSVPGEWFAYETLFWCAVAWPLWFVVLPFANRGERGPIAAPLVIGTVLWAFPAFALTFLMVLSGQKH